MVKLDLDLFDTTDMGDFLPMSDVNEVKRRCVLQAKTFLSLYTLQTQNLVHTHNAPTELVSEIVNDLSGLVMDIENGVNDINSLKLCGILFIDINEELLQAINFDDNDTDDVRERLKYIGHILTGDVNQKALVKKLKKMKEVKDGLRMGDEGGLFFNNSIIDEMPIIEVLNINNMGELRELARKHAKYHVRTFASYDEIIDGGNPNEDEEATFLAILYSRIDECKSANELKCFIILCLQLNKLLTDAISMGTEPEFIDTTTSMFSQFIEGNKQLAHLVTS